MTIYLVEPTIDHIPDHNGDAWLMDKDAAGRVKPYSELEWKGLQTPVHFFVHHSLDGVTDVPFNDMGWPIVSVRFLEALKNAAIAVDPRAPLTCREYAVRLYDEVDEVEVDADPDKFVLVQFTNRLDDVVDRQRSHAKGNTFFPDDIMSYDVLHLHPPTSGSFPVAFELAEVSVGILVNDDGYAALQSLPGGPRGLELVEIDVNTRS